jgi:hypothetical protein
MTDELTRESYLAICERAGLTPEPEILASFDRPTYAQQRLAWAIEDAGKVGWQANADGLSGRVVRGYKSWRRAR